MQRQFELGKQVLVNMKYKWEDNVRRVTPYTPGEQPKISDVIKLNTNENPYPPAPGVRMILEQMDPAALRKYPDPTASLLVDALSEAYHLPSEQIFVGVGSDDVLAMSFLTFFYSGRPVLFPDITYSFYDVWADVFRIPFRTIPLDEKFRIRTEDYLESAAGCGGIVIANPNAPTGEQMELADLEKIIAAHPDVVVIVDEAYVDFGAESALPLLEKYDNLLVVQTFSKSRSMAGMRIGCAFGSAALIRYLNDVKYSFNSYTMNLPSILAGKAALADDAYFRETCRKIVTTRERVKEQLRELGFVCGDSKANFLFVSHETVPAAELFEALKAEKIYVRYFKKPRIDNYLRITIGTDEEMDCLLSFLRKYLKNR